MAAAWKRVKANKGSAGVDGRTVQETGEYLKQAWPDIRARLLDGSYRPEPVRRVGIPKPGGGVRELGIPTVVDRLIQQALLQVLQPLIDPTFSEHSHGFRPGRSAHGAVLRGAAVRAGRLPGRGGRGPGEVLRPRQPRHPDGPAGQADSGQAGAAADPPLPASGHPGARGAQRTVRGHAARRAAVARCWPTCCWTRWIGSWSGADTGSCATPTTATSTSGAAGQGERVLQGLRGCYAKLALKVNESKTAVASVWGRKFLGYCFWAAPQGVVKLAVATQAMAQAARAHPAADTAHDGVAVLNRSLRT